VDGLDEAWILGIGLDFVSEHGDVVIDGAGGGKSAVTPNEIKEALAGDGFAGVLGEETENGEFLGSAMNGLAAAEKSLGGEINLNLAELEVAKG
jgi:hypothetical protein